MNRSTSSVYIIVLFVSGILFFTSNAVSQQTTNDSSSFITIKAGPEYFKSSGHQKRWGKNYREEWNTPVTVKKVLLDTLAGGLTPYEAGGGRQSKSLKLRDSKGREYVLRSINKSFGKALPDIVQGTFIEDVANDMVSIGHPYAALTIPLLAEAAGIYHTNPVILYVPKQKRLGTFNDEFGDVLYLFEQRPDENWEDAPNFGNAKNIISTEKLQEQLFENKNRKIDQAAYIRARLFDFLIGDWSRHEDQWRWAEFKTGSETIYKPIPRDRDQAYTLFEGRMTRLLTTPLDHLQSFDSTIEEITTYNFPARNLDRLAANEMTTEQWVTVAKDLQQRLTDAVIENSIRQMPSEVFPISGPEIIQKLKGRRDHLQEYALEYSQFIAQEVDIPGTDGSELFKVERLNNEYMVVSVFRIKDDNSISATAFYKRDFKTAETKEVRLYGLGGNDRFIINGKSEKSILLRIIPGKGADSLSDLSAVEGAKKMTLIYNNKRDRLTAGSETRIRISKDSTLNNYRYKHFEYNNTGMVFRPGLTIGMGYHFEKQGWRKEPFKSEHRFMVYYGPNRGSVWFEYRYRANQFIGKWNLEANARADFPFVANFYGIGNETVIDPDVNRKYYRFRRNALTLSVGVNRTFHSYHQLHLTGNVQSINIRNDEGRLITKEQVDLPADALNQKYYASGGAHYRFKRSDDPVIPTKGFEFNLGGAHTRNLKDADRNFFSYESSVSFYIPVFKVLSLASRVGGEAITGKPEFFQLAYLSGKENLRGVRRQRYYGKTSFYNNNELRLILNTRNKIFNGKIGLLAFIDQGRVWQPGEKSDRLHVGYGGGFFVAPFNKILLNASYGISKDDRVLHMRIGFLF
jgi:hypothetical protein